MCYSAEDLLPICEDLSVPLVFDYHHDSILPSSIPPAEIIKRANAIFERRGIRPKQHLSEPRPGAVTVMERRAHADRCQRLPDDLPDDVDLMIEAKDKEQAVFHLYRIYDLAPVIHANLRPPAEVETKETKGRKSHKPPGGTGRKKATEEGVVRDDDEAKGEDPAVPVEEVPEAQTGGGEVDADDAAPDAPRRSGRARKERGVKENALESEDISESPKVGKKKKAKKAKAKHMDEDEDEGEV
jgi:hypothetical protein